MIHEFDTIYGEIDEEKERLRSNLANVQGLSVRDAVLLLQSNSKPNHNDKTK